MDGTSLYGRQGDFDNVTNSEPGLLLVVGDSGIGKSSFLSSLDAWPGESLISKPIVLKSTEGSLQTAMADAISDCISHYLKDASDPHTAWTVLKSLGERVATVSGREVVRAVLSGSLAYVESKIGKEAVAIGKSVLGDIAKGGVLGFDEQLAKVRVPDHTTELCDIAAALSETAERPVVLRFDNAERLAPGDQGLMAELADAVRGNVRIVVCVTPHDEAGDDLIHKVAMRGDPPYELRPLATPAVEQWLASADVPKARWDTITRLSSGYPFFINDAVQLSGPDGSLDDISAPKGFLALMQASWKRIPAPIQSLAARLTPFADPPSEEFLMNYLGMDIVELGVLITTLVDSGIFVIRSDGEAWFHDRRRLFIWEKVLPDKYRKHVAAETLDALAVWIEDREGIEYWVPPAAAAVTRAAAPLSVAVPSSPFHTMPDEGVALLWGLIEVIEPDSSRAPYAEIAEVIRHSEARSGLSLDALALVGQLEAEKLVETLETPNVRLIRSRIDSNAAFAALLGEIQLRFHSTPRPRLASAVFDAFVRPALGEFDAAVVSLGRTSLGDHKKLSSQLLRSARIIGGNREPLTLGATVSVDDQLISFTAKFPTSKSRTDAERAIEGISALTRVQLERVVPLPQPRLQYARYRLGVETLGGDLQPTANPTYEEVLRFFDLRARYTNALGTVSSRDEIEVLDLGGRRYLLSVHDSSSTWGRSWTGFEVLTDEPQPPQVVSDIVSTPRDPLAELRLRAAGKLAAGEQIARTVFQAGTEISLPHPLVAVLEDIEKAGKAYNDGFRSLLLPPDAALLERKIQTERHRVFDVIDALSSAEAVGAGVPRRSLLLAFWEDTESGWPSDFGNWSACAFEIDDGQGAVLVRRLDQSPVRDKWRPDVLVPEVFEGYLGAEPVSSERGDASWIISRLLGYADHDARMMDLETELGRIVRSSGTYAILGECEGDRSIVEVSGR